MWLFLCGMLVGAALPIAVLALLGIAFVDTKDKKQRTRRSEFYRQLYRTD